MSVYKYIKQGAKICENFFRKFRHFLFPSTYWNFFCYVKKGLNLPSPDHPCAVFDFKSTEIDYVGGRYFYYLVQDTIAAGYYPVFRNNLRFLSTLPHKPFKKLLLNDPFGVATKSTKLPEGSIYFSDHIKESSANKAHIFVSYAYTLPKNESEFQLPFAFFPHLIKREQELLTLNNKEQRSRKVFFGGKSSHESHGKAALTKQYQLVSRAQACLLYTSDAADD